MIENLPEKLGQEKRKQSKDAKIYQMVYTVLDGNMSVKNAPKLQQNIWQTKYAKSNKYKTFQ